MRLDASVGSVGSVVWRDITPLLAGNRTSSTSRGKSDRSTGVMRNGSKMYVSQGNVLYLPVKNVYENNVHLFGENVHLNDVHFPSKMYIIFVHQNGERYNTFSESTVHSQKGTVHFTNVLYFFRVHRHFCRNNWANKIFSVKFLTDYKKKFLFS